jgi:hypothetical protein
MDRMDCVFMVKFINQAYIHMHIYMNSSPGQRRVLDVYSFQHTLSIIRLTSPLSNRAVCLMQRSTAFPYGKDCSGEGK